MRPLWLALASALTLGCGTLDSGDDRVNPDKPLWMHRPNGAMSILFMRELTAASRTQGEAYELGRPAIDVFHGRVFVGTSDHGLYALRASNGSTIWRFETLGLVQSEPLYDSDLDIVYFGSNDGALYAVQAADGRLVFRYESGAEVARKPVIAGETLFFANHADNLFAIDRRSGKTLWRVHRTPALGMEVTGYAGPSYDRGSVYFAYSDGHVGAYDARDGSEKWPPVDLAAEVEQAQGGEAARYLDVDTTPIPDELPQLGRVIFVASYAGGVFALDAERGAPLWKNDKATGVNALALWRQRSHAPAADGPDFVRGAPRVPKREVLIASSGGSGLWALDPATGHQIWRLPVPEGGITAPAPLAGALLIGTTHYGAFLVSPIDGRPIDGFDLGSGFAETPATFGNRGYLVSNAGTLVAVEVEAPPVAGGRAAP